MCGTPGWNNTNCPDCKGVKTWQNTLIHNSLYTICYVNLMFKSVLTTIASWYNTTLYSILITHYKSSQATTHHTLLHTVTHHRISDITVKSITKPNPANLKSDVVVMFTDRGEQGVLVGHGRDTVSVVLFYFLDWRFRVFDAARTMVVYDRYWVRFSAKQS